MTTGKSNSTAKKPTVKKSVVEEPSFFRKNRGVLTIAGVATTALLCVSYCGNNASRNRIIDAINSSHAKTDSTIIATGNTIQETVVAVGDTIDNRLDSIDYHIDKVQATSDSIYAQAKENGQKIDSVSYQITIHDTDMKKNNAYTNRLINNNYSNNSKAKSKTVIEDKQKLLDDLFSSGKFNSSSDNKNCLEDDLYFSDWGSDFSLKPMQETSYMRAFEAEQKALQEESQKNYLFRKKN